MSTRKPKDEQGKQENINKTALMVIHTFGSIAEKFGVAFAVLALSLFVVWLFGDEQTRIDFIRELLFGERNQKPWLQAFYVALMAIVIGASFVQSKGNKSEKKEMARISDEKSRLQEQLLGRTLNHEDHKTNPPPGIPVEATSPPGQPEKDPRNGGQRS